MPPMPWPWYRNPFYWLMIVVAIVVAAGSYWYVDAMLAKQGRCDEMARESVLQLGRAWKYFQKGVADMGCDPELAIPTEKRIGYIYNLYYGWGGSEKWSYILIKLERNTACACSMLGRVPGTDNRMRTIYRVDLRSGKELPSVVGPCEGKEYYRGNVPFYESTMLRKEGDVCRIVEPERRRGF